MSRLGGNSPSADTDKSNNLKGDPGTNGTDGTDGSDGVVASVVAGTNIDSIDNTDPANPIINAATQSAASPTTTKGDVIARGASVDERVAVGTDGQVLVADAASSAGVKFADAAAGGAGGGAIQDVFPDVSFWMTGDLAASAGQKLDLTLAGDQIRIDFIYFAPATTTISTLGCYSATASAGGTLTVALHPLLGRCSIGTQDFVSTITVGTVGETAHETAIGTPWVVPKGWYALVSWSPVNISNVLGRYGASTLGSNQGLYYSGKMAFHSPTVDEVESKSMFVFSTDYDVSADLTGIDFNDETLWKDAPAAGEIGMLHNIPIIILKVSATT